MDMDTKLNNTVMGEMTYGEWSERENARIKVVNDEFLQAQAALQENTVNLITPILERACPVPMSEDDAYVQELQHVALSIINGLLVNNSRVMINRDNAVIIAAFDIAEKFIQERDKRLAARQS